MGKPKNKPKSTMESRLIQLPIEVLEKIGEKLKDETATLSLRLTCSTLKSLVDNYLGIKTTIVEQPGYPKRKLDFVRRVCLHEVIFKNMIGQLEASNGLRTYFKYRYYFDDIFRYPHFLTEIGLDGKTDVQFLFDVMTKCINLEVLCLLHEFEFQGDLVALLTKENNINPDDRSSWLSMLSQRDEGFRQIKFRKLNFLHLDFRSKVSNNSLLNLMLLLKCTRSEALKRSAVLIGRFEDFTEMEYFHLSCIVAEFLEGHVATLKDFGMCMESPKEGAKFSPNMNDIFIRAFNEHVQIEPNEIQGDGDSDVDQKIKMILSLRDKLEAIGNQSKLTYLYIQIPPDFHWDYWLLFIEKLKYLNHLRMCVSTKYEILKNCQMVRNSKKTLKRLRLLLDLINNFDFSGIEECEKLEEVYLFNRPFSTEFISQGPLEAHVKNVKLIPPGIKGMCLGNVVVATEDLNKMLSIQKDLDTLVVMNMPCLNPDSGIDYKCLKKIFRMRTLHSCFIQSVRCKTNATFHKVNNMLHFQMPPNEEAMTKKMRILDGLLPPGVGLTSHNLDILSKEIYCRYTWIKMVLPDGHMYNCSCRLNDGDRYL